MAIVTLITDFGTRDHFAGAMKGVILGIAPRATVVDITHEIAPFETGEAAFAVSETWRLFPKGSVHVVVVDPGVGTSRRPILVEAAGHYFLGPDNGVLSLVYTSEKARVREVTARKYFRAEVSSTFHGRDVFAPVAAHLAKGVRPAQLGRRIDDYLRPNLHQPERTGTRTWAGSVLKVDRFGNIITSFHVEKFPAVRQRPIVLIAGVRAVEKVVGTYGEGAPGEPVVIVGSSGYVEISINQGSAARALGCVAGTPVELSIY